MLILGVESSCDETAASVTKDGRTVLSDVVHSQIPIHERYGGVVPEIASRCHVEQIVSVMQRAIAEAGIKKEDLDAVAVTHGPGLVGALLVGVSAAKAFAYAIGKPLIAVNHIHGHIAANYIASPTLTPPFVCLVASGGHSHIVHVKDYRKFEVLGATRDDAAGEAFDKAARVLGLGYPGGPKLSKLAEEGNPQSIAFPRPDFGLDFSFSGLKTAVINTVHKMEQNGEEIPRADVAASFQQAAVDVLVRNTMRAAKQTDVKKICLAGGVASNALLRTTLQAAAESEGFSFFVPPPALCTDNGAMISCAGYYAFSEEHQGAPLDLNAIPSLSGFDSM